MTKILDSIWSNEGFWLAQQIKLWHWIHIVETRKTAGKMTKLTSWQVSSLRRQAGKMKPRYGISWSTSHCDSLLLNCGAATVGSCLWFWDVIGQIEASGLRSLSLPTTTQPVTRPWVWSFGLALRSSTHSAFFHHHLQLSYFPSQGNILVSTSIVISACTCCIK